MLLMIMGGVTAWGLSWTVTISDYAATSFTTSDGRFTISCEKNSGQNSPIYNASAKDLRVYAKGSVTIKCNTGTLNSLYFNLSSQGMKRLAPITASVGTVGELEVGSNTVQWTAPSGTEVSEVTFTVGDKAEYGSDGSSKAGQLCFNLIVIDMTDGEVAPTPVTIPAPTFSPTAGEVEDGTVVTISNGSAAADYDILYTIDGTSPVDNGIEGNSVTISGEPGDEVTIKAVATDGDGNFSEVATAVYTVKEETPEVVVPNIAALRVKDVDAEYTLQLDGAEVLAVNNQNVYVRDANGGTASALSFYQSGQSWQAGQILTGTVKGTYKIYSLLPEMTTFSSIDIEVGAAPAAPQPKSVEVADATIDNYAADYIEIEGEVTQTGSNYYIGSVQLFNQKNIAASVTALGGNVDATKNISNYVTAGNTYKVAGILVPYNSKPELLVVNVELVEETIPTPTFSPAAGEVEDGTVVTITAGEDYEIYYTLDGSSPVGNNDALGDGNATETVTISGEPGTVVTIKAMAVNEEGDHGEVAEAVYTVKEAVEVEEPAEAELPEGVLFWEQFSQVDGTGGRDDAYNGTVASSDIFGNSSDGEHLRTTDMVWEYLSKDYKCYGAKESMKFGTASASGECMTREIDLSGDGTLSFSAAGWASGSNTLIVQLMNGYVFDDGETQTTSKEITLTNGSWTDYTYAIKRVETATEGTGMQVHFAGKRGFIDDIKVMEGGAVIVNVPVISPEGGVFTEPVEVTISSDQEEAIVYYTLDGTDPTNESTQFTEAFTLTETTTVKAVAYINDIPSNVVQATFTFPTVCNSIAEFRQLEVGETAILKLDGAQVLAVAGSNVYVRDNGEDVADAICFYQCALGDDVQTGCLLYGQLTGTRADYNGLPEVTNATDISLQCGDVEGDLSWVRDLTLDEVTLDDYVADLIMFEGTVTKTGNNYYIGDIQLYVNNQVAAANSVYGGEVASGDKVSDLVEEGKNYLVAGIFTSYNNNPELLLLHVEEKTQKVEVEYTFNSYGIGTLYYSDLRFGELPEGVTASIITGIEDKTLQEQTLSTNNGSFIPRGCPVILRGEPGSTVTLIGKDEDKGDQFTSNMLRGTDEAETIDIATAQFYYYILSAKNGEVGFYWAADGGGSFENAAHKAYLALTPDQAALAPAFYFNGTTGITSVTSELDDNAPIYNLAGQRVTSSYKGVVIQNGVKKVRK